MEEVHVSTYCVPSSYGSIYQSLGLKMALKELGFESTVHQVKSPPGEEYQIHITSRSPRNIWIAFQKYRVYKSLNLRHKNTRQFIHNNLDLEYHKDLLSMREKLSGAQICLAGSDQIWNPNNLAPEFFLEFSSEKAKKFSYAASMGVVDIPEDQKKNFARMVQKFDTISVREEESAAVVSALTAKPVQVHIDPTFLCLPEFWRSLQKPYSVEKPYILVYPLYWDKKWNRQLKALRRKTGKEIVVFAEYRRNIYGTRWAYDADPGQLLWLIDHADAVISSSFHGLALGLQMNRPVVSLINPAAPSRISHLMKLLECPELEISDLEAGLMINYEPINTRIAEERQRGISYLKEILGQ